MKLILRSDVDTVGKKGDQVDVADGYGRNFLLPKGKAILATQGVVKQAEAMRSARAFVDTKDREAAQALAARLSGVTVTIEHNAGAEGKLFGSVTSADLAAAIRAQTSVEVDRRVIQLDEPIKSVGSHVVPLKLHADVHVDLPVEVVAAS